MNDVRPKLFVVTVCRNAGLILPDTLRALPEQDDQWHRYFIIDGASTDDTIDLARAFASNYPGRVTVISEPDEGIYHAMNKGIKRALVEAADDDLIALINAGDAYLPEALNRMVEAAQAHPAVDVFYGDCVLVDETNKPTGRVRTSQSVLPSSPDCFEMPLEHQTMCVRAHVYRHLGLYDESYRIAADYEFILRLIAQKVPTMHVGASVTAFREGGVSMTALDDSYQEMIRARIAHGASPFLENARFLKQKTNEFLYAHLKSIPAVTRTYEKHQRRNARKTT